MDPNIIPNKNSSIVTKKVLSWVLIAVMAGVAVHYYRPFLRKLIAPPCTSPITYRVDALDNRFKISDEKFKQAIAQAGEIWSKVAGKELFKYDAKGSMPISLVYDQRQQATDKLKSLNINLDSTESSYNQLKTIYEQYKTQLDASKQLYDQMEQQYNALKQSYESEVNSVNSHGGATPQQYRELNAERDRLNNMSQQLNDQAAQINQQVQDLNAIASNLNRLGNELNLNVSQYNSIGENLGEFEEGVYVSGTSGEKITIYEFTDYNTLVRVLAHELGHSLGLEHVSDPKAIMYKLNQSKNAVPTKADIAELKRVCKL